MKAVCGGCGMPRYVRQDGMIAKHTRRQYRPGSYTVNIPCKGGGKPPLRKDTA